MTTQGINRIAELKELSSSIEKEYAGIQDIHAYKKNTIESTDSLITWWAIR